MRADKFLGAMGLFIASLLLFGCSVRREGRADESPGAPTADAGEGRGRIAFVGADSNIYIIGPEGGEPVSVTGDAHDDRPNGSDFLLYESPAWAPVTGNLAFIGIRDSDQGGPLASIHMLEPGGSEREVLYSSDSEFPFYLFWSPAGEQITFLANLEGGESLGLWRGASGQDAVLLDQGQPYYWDWAPSGEVLFSHVGGSSNANAEGARFSLVGEGEVNDIGPDLEVLSFQAPAYSPAGDHILAVVEAAGFRGGLAVLTEAGAVESVLASPRGPMAFDWSASGDYVAYVTGGSLGGNLVGDLTVLDVRDPGDPRRIETGAHGVLAFWWSHATDHLAYFVPTPADDSPDQLISTHQQDEELLFGIYILDPKTGESELRSRFRPTRDLLQILPFYDQYQRSVTFWSPDGEEFVYANEGQTGEPGIFVVSATAPSAPRRIATGRFAVWSWE